MLKVKDIWLACTKMMARVEIYAVEVFVEDASVEIGRVVNACRFSLDGTDGGQRRFGEDAARFEEQTNRGEKILLLCR